MDTEGFRKYLSKQALSEAEIQAAIALIQRYEIFIQSTDTPQATSRMAAAFSQHLIAQGENTLANYYALARYGRFSGDDDLYTGVVDLLDGAEALGNLHKKAETILGTERRDALFDDIDLPPLGTPNREKVVLNQAVMTRLVDTADSQECSQILSDSLRDLEDSWFQEDVKLFEECKDIDEFLDRSESKFIAMLEKIQEEDGLFFTQKITDEVIAYVKSQPLISRGLREGDTLYEVKIPHQTVEYLAETDPHLKRYYYCHCPWVKEGLKTGPSEIPPVFCNCSAGFHKKRWEVIFRQPLKAEIVETVLAGDDVCKIAIHLPLGL